MSPRELVTADGTKLHLELSGPDDAAVTVVLVHGWTQDLTCWEPVVQRLRDQRLLRYDHRGHGRSTPARRGTATIEQLADDLAEVLGAVVPEGRLVLAGHSMGGMTIMALAERHPELVSRRVAGVAFVATSSGEMNRLTLGLPGLAGRGVTRAEPRVRNLLERRRKDTLPGSPGFLAPFTRWLAFGRGAARADVLDVSAQALRAHPASIAGFLEAITRHDRRLALAALRGTPAVVLAGQLDRLCPVPHARVIADELPEAEFVYFPKAGHMLPYERADEVAARVRALTKVPVLTGV